MYATYPPRSFRIERSNAIVHCREDLIGASALTNNQILQPGVIASFGGTSSLLTNTATEEGYQQLTTGAGATNKAGLTSSASGKTIFLATSKRVYVSMKVGVSFLSDGVSKYKGMYGLTSTPNDVTGTSALAFWLDQTAPVNNWMIAIGSGAVTPAATGLVTVPVTVATLYHLEIDCVGNAASLAINGTIVHTTTTGIPTATALGWYCGLVKNAGAADIGQNIDWCDVEEYPPTARNASAFQ